MEPPHRQWSDRNWYDIHYRMTPTQYRKRHGAVRAESGRFRGGSGRRNAGTRRIPNPTIYSVFPLHDSSGKLIGTMCGFYYTEKADSSHLARTKLQPALEWMTQHAGETTSLETLARLTNLSVTHFRRLFMETFKKTPAKYALRLRLNRARDMLETTDYTVASIAMEAGFYDQSHFVKAFQRIYRMTPTQYRKRHGAIRAESGQSRGETWLRNARTMRTRT